MADDLSAIDSEGFARELDALRGELEAEISHEDFAHLRKLERWASTCTAVGYATGWLAPNPLSAIALSLGSTARWTIVVHHVSHKSMDKVPGIPERYTSRVFAQGSRRMLDWFDWMLPDGAGTDLCAELRAASDPTPVLILTARVGVEDRVLGLDAGADDYLKKPFAAAELSARDYVFRGPEVRRMTAEQFADAIGSITGEWSVYQPPVRSAAGR